MLAVMHHPPLPMAGVAAVLLAAIQVVIDWLTWIELNEAIVYTLPLVLAAMARSRRLLWGLTLFLVVTTIAVYTVQIGPGVFSPNEPLFINRVLAAATILLTAGLLHAWTLALNKLEEQDRSLKSQNEQLDAANRELLRCHAEITLQNVELDGRRQEAEDASGRKSRLLASVSHDIRSPLTAITLTTDVIRLMATDPALAAKLPGLVERLQANARSLGDMVTDVLDLTSIESGRVELHESEISLNQMLAEECRRLLPLARAKNLALTAGLTVPALRINADRVKLARVLGNLVTNAIKFTETGGVTLTAGLTPERDVVISVRDTGVGIAAGSLNRIFDEFARLRAPGREYAEGWGLGLAVCRRLVEMMGGAITVASEPDHGSVFSVHLPASCLVDRPEGETGCIGCGKNGESGRAVGCT